MIVLLKEQIVVYLVKMKSNISVRGWHKISDSFVFFVVVGNAWLYGQAFFLPRYSILA